MSKAIHIMKLCEIGDKKERNKKIPLHLKRNKISKEQRKFNRIGRACERIQRVEINVVVSYKRPQHIVRVMCHGTDN
jgi:hypothetical protein